MAKQLNSKRKYTTYAKANVFRLVSNGKSILAVAKKMDINDSIEYA